MSWGQWGERGVMCSAFQLFGDIWVTGLSILLSVFFSVSALVKT